MSFRLTIDIPDSKLAAMIRRLAGHKVTVESTEKYVPGWDDPRKAKSNGKTHSRAASLLTMTGKEPNKNSQLSAARVEFEKLEKKLGIGTVTMGDFRKHLVNQKMPKALGQRCVTEKVLAYL